MKKTNVIAATLLGAGLLLATAAQAQPRAVDLGKREYDSNCASCHGAQGKGDGLYVEWLKRAPPDLSRMAAGTGGVSPVARAYEVIEGEGPGHGGRDMPIWGRDYRIMAGEYYMDVPYDPAVYVRSRILALVEYLNRLQVR